MVSGLGESVDTILPVYDTRAYYCQKKILSEYKNISQVDFFGKESAIGTGVHILGI